MTSCDRASESSVAFGARPDDGCGGVSARPGRLRRISDRRLRLLPGIGVAAIILSAGAGRADDEIHRPHHIVSLNMCADELLLRVADRRDITSITWLASESGNAAELARGVPVNHGLAEEIIPLNPDLVLAGVYTARMAVSLIKRTGIPVVELDAPNGIDAVRRQYLDVAKLLGEPARGERVVAAIDEGLARIPRPPATGRPRAIVLNANGFTVGPHTLANEIMTRAGLENVAETLKIDNYDKIPLETVITQGVEVLIVSAVRDQAPAIATEILKHPVLSKIADRTQIVVMPQRLWGCGGPAIVDAVELLADAARDARATRR